MKRELLLVVAALAALGCGADADPVVPPTRPGPADAAVPLPGDATLLPLSTFQEMTVSIE